MRIGEVGLMTNNVIRLADFYKKLFKIDNDSDDNVHQFIITEGTSLTIHNDGSEKNNNNQNMCIAFTVDDVDEEFIRLQELGVNVIEPPTVRPRGAKNMIFSDPDGNRVIFRSFPK